ncbi:MAG: DUF3102 domain-containing protein [Clostridia bacterium]|nr:DUF3102 domain-containing protein [Clostridia bacterium]
MANVQVKKQESASVRNIGTITAEIQSIKRQTNALVLSYAIEIGRRLVEAKAALPHGQWGDWLKTEVDFSQSTANNLMRLFDEYGSTQISFFGASINSNSQSIANLNYTKALQLLAVPSEEREAFAEEVGAEDLSVKELKAKIEERDRQIKEAEKKLADVVKQSEKKAKAEVDAIRRTAKAEAKKEAEEKVKKDLDEAKKQVESAEAKATKAKEAEDRARKDLEETQRKLKTASPEIAAFKALFDEMQGTAARLRCMIEEIRKNDPETADKLSAALKAFGGSL